MSELVLVANAGDGTVSTLALQREQPAHLKRLAVSAVGPGIGTFAVDSARDLVFAAAKGAPPVIVTLRLDRGSGRLTEVARRPVEASMTYLCLGHGGSIVLGASYGGGFAATWPVHGHALGEPRARVEFAHPHCVLAVEGRAYVVALGDDLLAQYALGTDGSLTPMDPPTVAAPRGSGPRHLVVAGSDAYVMTEFSGEVIRFGVGPGGVLSRAESVSAVDARAGLAHSRLGADPTEERLVWGADIHRAGPWLLASERSASTLASIRLEHGRLEEVAAITPTLRRPRGFGVSPDGSHVVVVGEKASTAALYRVEDDGSLTLLHEVPVGAGANWVRIIPRG